MTTIPIAVRAATFAAALGALLLAAPAGPRALPLVLVGIVVLAGLPAVLPAGPWATIAIVAAGTGFAFAGEPGPVRVLVLAGLLYCVHSLAGLAAALPLAAVVAPDVLVRWLLRTVAVIGAGSLLAVAVLAGLGTVNSDRTHAAATLAGLGFAVAVAVAVTRFSRLSARTRSRRG
ncbi:MAG TPA: hypothetical protein VIL37_12525 [Natronosporangium sp.]